MSEPDRSADDLIAHLRGADIGVCDEAADEIERLRSKVGLTKTERTEVVKLVEGVLNGRLPADLRIDFPGTASAVIRALRDAGWL